MKKKTFLLMALAVGFVSCVKEDIKEGPADEVQDRGTLVLSASMPEYHEDVDTRTELDGFNVIWNQGDEIAVVDHDQTVHVGKNIDVDGQTARFSTNLTLTDEGKVGGGNFKNNNHLVIYPSSQVYRIESGSNYVKGIEVPDSQPLVANNIGSSCNISFALLNTQSKYNGDNLKFYNACGLLRLKLRGDARIRYISITAPSGSVLVGTGTIHSDNGGFINKDWFEFKGTKTVTLEAEDGDFQLTEEVTDFYACVVPAHSYGFSWGNITDEMKDTDTGAKAGKYTITFTNDRNETITTTAILENNVVAGKVSTLGQFKINDKSEKWQSNENPKISKDDGLDYVFDTDELAEIRLNVSLDEWNRLLGLYDKNPDTDEYIYCDVKFTTKGQTHSFKDAGIRLRGNTSRRRPEAGAAGSQHNAENPDWQHCHFMINLRKFLKDDAHKIGDVRKIHLKWFKEDPSYIREPFCFDVFRRNGIWTSMKTSYCRLWIHVEGDENPAYYGVYTMLEAIDERYLKARKSQFGTDKHNLWKCSNGADLISTDPSRFENDPHSGTKNFPYVLKTNTENYNAAKAQLVNFITNINTLEGEEYRTWINKVTDVELLLKTYATSVALGNWDDYWCGANNYYMYFNSDDPENYRFFFIPYDFDHSLGISSGIDTGRQNPLQWYANDEGKARKLISKLLEFEDYRALYLDTMRELLHNPELMSEEGSRARIMSWQSMIGPYISNDTGEDMIMEDTPVSYGYQLLIDSDRNYFRTKALTVQDTIESIK